MTVNEQQAIRDFRDDLLFNMRKTKGMDTSPDSGLYELLFDESKVTVRIKERLYYISSYIRIKELRKITVGTPLTLVPDYNSDRHDNNEPWYNQKELQKTIRADTSDGIKLGLLGGNSPNIDSCFDRSLFTLISLDIVSIKNARIIYLDTSDGRRPRGGVMFDVVGKDPSFNEAFKVPDVNYVTKPIEIAQKPETIIETYLEGNKDSRWIWERNQKSYFLYARFRGFKTQILELQDFLRHEDGYMRGQKKTVTPDIWEVEVTGSSQDQCTTVRKIMAQFPELKMVSFFNYGNLVQYVVISEPGYDRVSQASFVCHLDPKSDYMMQYDDPTKDFTDKIHYTQTSDVDLVKYKFPFEKEWRKFDYIFTNNNQFMAVTEVTLPNYIEKLENYAYSDSDTLEKIRLPKSLKTIQPLAFSGSENLQIIQDQE